MTKEEALKVLVKMRAWRRWGKGEQNEEDMPEMPEQKEVDEALDVYIEVLSQHSLPSNLEEAAEDSWEVYEYRESPRGLYSTCYVDGFKACAEWMAGQGGTVTEAYVVELNKDKGLNWLQIPGKQLCDALKKFNIGDEVVVQIRKK